MSSKNSFDSFSVTQARDIVKDLFAHREWVYWSDFLATMTVGYSSALIYLNAPLGSLRQIVCFFIAGFALFRLASFMHEIVHMTGKTMLGFRIAWNVMAGIPMLMPSFFYSNHIDHHSTRHFGTGQDGEYLPLGNGTRSHVLGFVLPTFFLPLAVLLRFLVLTPVSFLHPRLRRWTLEHASSFVMNLRYRHQIPRNAPLKTWAVLEFFCFLRAFAMVGFVVAGMASPTRLVLLYLLGVVALGLNYLRNLAAHHYRSEGKPISHVAQFADSINLTGTPILTELFFPVGLRYHALHHLFPSLPYHNLGLAHRRLLAELPADSPYHSTVYPGFWSAFRELLVDAARGSRRRLRGQPIVADAWYRRRQDLLKDEHSPRDHQAEPHMGMSARVGTN